jgi:PAS domain S-box-containing protein
MKQKIERKTELVHQRNILMFKIVWGFYLFDMLVTILTNRYIEPIGIVLGGILAILIWKRVWPVFIMFLTITFIFIFFFSLISSIPILTNYIFMWIGLVLSTLYHNLRVVLLAGFYSLSLTVYFFYTTRDQLFPTSTDTDIIYLVLFGTFVTVYFLFFTRFTNLLWLKAERNEQKAKHELHSTQEYLQSFFNNTTDAIAVFDLDGKVLTVNPAFEALYGWSNKELVGQSIPIIPEQLWNDAEARWKEVQEGVAIIGRETKHQRKDGREIDAEVTISPIRNEKGKVIALSAILRDITDKKRTEEMVLRSEKLSVVGEMAAGVAHEIRNPLAVLSGFIQILHNESGQNHKYTEIMMSELKRINLIIGEFLILAKPHVVRFEQCNLMNILDDVLTLFDSQINLNNVQVERNHPKILPTLMCEPNQLKQVFINILKNAIEAMPQGGTITLSIDYDNSQRVHIQFSDEGVGLPEEVLSKVGQPFFTTKEEGTGLGLMVTQRIIENHHGEMKIRSKVNEGTAVEVILPVL